jgi:TonB family protein
MKPRAALPAPATTQPAPSSPPAGATRAVLSIVALSEDPMLLEALMLAAVDQASVVSAPSADRFADQLVSNSAAVALIDAAVAPAPLDGFIASVHQQFPQMLLLLAGPASLQNQFAAQLADGTIFRFAHKPASAQRLKLFVDAALLRRQALVDQAMGLVPAGAAATPGATAQNPFGSPGRRRPLLWLSVCIGVLLLAAAAGALLWQRTVTGAGPAPAASGENTPAATPTSAPSSAALAAQAAKAAEAERDAIDQAAADRAERDRLISESEAREAALADQVKRTAASARTEQAHVFVQLAQKRLASGALLEPADDSARSYVQGAVGLAPDDADVRSVALALGEALIAKFRAALAADDAEAAARWLQACRDYHLGDGTLEQMGTQLGALQHAQSSRAEELQALQRQFTQHLATGALLEPADENALANYRRLKALDPGNVALPTMLHSLATAVTADVQARIAHNDLAGADQRLHAALDAGLDGEELAGAAAALERVQAVATPEVIPEARLQRSHFVAPVYPEDALAKRLSGSVELEFTVSPSGEVTDIKIQAADPPGVFDRAAISALSQSRYHPVLRDGVAIAQRARLRLRFKP